MKVVIELLSFFQLSERLGKGCPYLQSVYPPLKGGRWVGRSRGAGQVEQVSGLVEQFPNLVQASGNFATGYDGIQTRPRQL